jgi:hypothetical protein
MTRRGVYFLANDRILELAVAFLNSFRAHNPSVPLCLVPYAEDIDELRRLESRYDFTVWPDEAPLRWCDGISRSFQDRPLGQYRKLAMWTGPFDEFVYIDCDTVVLHDIDFVFGYLDRYEFVTSHSDMAEIRRWVWKDSITTTGLLTDAQISYAANTGFLASRRECLPRARVEARLPDALALADHMELICCEQPLLNYLIVTSGLRFTSLRRIADETRAWFRIPAELWAGDPSLRVKDGRVVYPHTPALMVHWAGEWERARAEGGQIPYHDLWSYYRNLTSGTG